MTSGVRGAIGIVLGLAMMQLVLSSSEADGKTGKLLGVLFQYPAALVKRFVDPRSPAVPDLSGTPAAIPGTNASSAVLPGKGTPTGTGSSTISI